MDILQMVNSIVVTLNSIEVKGEDNMDKLLGCIVLSKEIQKQLKSEKKETKEEKSDG